MSMEEQLNILLEEAEEELEQLEQDSLGYETRNDGCVHSGVQRSIHVHFIVAAVEEAMNQPKRRTGG